MAEAKTDTGGTTEEVSSDVPLSKIFVGSLVSNELPQSNQETDNAVQANVGKSESTIEKERPGKGKCELVDIPAVDTEAIKALEVRAKELERNLHQMMENLTRNMNSISSCSVQYTECYRECIKNTGNASDTATKAMANLIGKCEEMNRNMEPLYSMAEQVNTIKLLLDQFEDRCK